MRMHLALVLPLWLAACAGMPVPELLPAPFAPAPSAQWQGVGGEASTSVPSFWAQVPDATLEAFRTQALAQNLDIAASAARAEQAMANVASAGAALWPSLAVGGGASRDWRDGTQSTPTAGTPRTVQKSAQATLSFEADVFGRLRATRKAARLGAAQQKALQEAVTLSVEKTLAQTYWAYRGAEAQAANVAQQVALQAVVVKAAHTRVAAGLAAPTAEAEALQQAAALAQQLATATEQKARLKDTLAVLVGQNPLGFEVPSGTLPMHIPSPKVVQPAEVLARRPDIRAAERALAAAGADVQASRAAWAPRLVFSATEAALFDPVAWTTTLAANITQSLFDGGAKSATLRRTRARQAELLATYRSTVLNATAETNTAWVALQQGVEGWQAATQAAQAAQVQAQALQAQAKAGLTDEASAAAVAQRALATQASALALQVGALQAAATTYAAMGGE